MWQKIKKPLLIALCTLIGLLLLAVISSFVFSDKIIGYVVSELNKNLKTKVDVKHIDFSVIRKFPNASIELQNVYAAPAKPFSQKDTLLYADKIYLLFDLIDMIKGHYDLKKISIENASVKMYTDILGNKSFDIWKTDSTAKEPSKLKMSFDEVDFKNVLFVYNDYQQKKFYDLLFEKSRLNGNFSDAEYNLKSEAEVYVNQAKLGQDQIVSQKKAKINFNMKVDNVNKIYHFDPSTLQLEGLNLAVQGRLHYQPEQTEIDLTLDSKDADIISLLSVIPKSSIGILKEYDAQGLVTFNAKLTGVIGNNQLPTIAVNFSTDHAQLTPPTSNAVLKNISFKGFYTNKKSPSKNINYFSLKNFKAELGQHTIRANFEMENSAKPFINLTIDAGFNLRQLSNYYKPDTLESIEGTLLINANFTGQIGASSTYNSTGTAELQRVNFALKNSPTEFKNFSSSFNLKDNELKINGLSGNIASSDFRINGVIENIFDYIFLNNQILKADADFISNKLNLDEIIVAGDSKNDTAGGIHFSPYLNCNLLVSIGQLNYKKFEARHISGSVTLEDGVLNTNSLSMQTLDGTVNIQGTIDASRGDSVLISYDAKLNLINISKAFVALNNFGQQQLTDKNIKGKVSASVQFASLWSRQLILNTNSIYSKCDITIENGELINYQPMLALGRFVKGSDLHDVKFDVLHNVIEIKNRMITIPVMNIRSTALNLTASGTHTFDNVVDYKIKMDLSQLLNKKVGDNITEFGTIEDDGLGRWKLYLTMKGNISNPKFAYDKKSVQQDIAKEIKQEKQTMKTLLNKEFGWFKKDSAVVKQNQPQKKKEEIQIEYDTNDEK